MPLSPDALDSQIRSDASLLAQKIGDAATGAHNEREFQNAVTKHIEAFADKAGLQLNLREEYTLINGRADAVYNRLVIEYEPPFSLKKDNRARANDHAIGQVRTYLQDLVRVERHKPERLAGVVLDGGHFIFVRQREKTWHVDDPVPVDRVSVERFLRTLSAMRTELALIPDNLVRDFGPATTISRQCVATFYAVLQKAANPKVHKLYEQWGRMFSEVCDYDVASKLDVHKFAKIFGVKDSAPDPFRLFFCIHTYYATFIKLLAVQVAVYYTAPKLGTGLKAVASYESGALLKYLHQMERGGIFKELGINNFLEGDFFQWYLEIWDEPLCEAIRSVVAQLADYSLVTLDVDPELTRDLLKKLYQDLMPRELRHNLGEYYTPDWLAERLIGQVVGKRRQGDYPQCDPRKRYLDPACGSGTFLVLVIRFIRRYVEEHIGHLREPELLNLILQNVTGFDLNPLAVISARTNYLLALGDLLQHRSGEINIPIYLADSIMTPGEGSDLHSHGKFRFNTAVGEFELPKTLITAQYVDTLASLLEQCVEIARDKPIEQAQAVFTERALEAFPLDKHRDDRDIQTLQQLFAHLHELERRGVNGIWARIIKNAFAPVFTRNVDFVIGNPPWVNWESLPKFYRDESKVLWDHYGLFTLKGWRARMGGGKKDISVLMTYVSVDKYLKDGGRLGFVITQTIFKTEGGAEGFRRFRLGEKGKAFGVFWVDDMSALKPFEGAANRTAILVCDKGKHTKYPVNVGYWRKKPEARGLPEDASLDEILDKYIRMSQWTAEPIDDSNPYSPWISGRPKALRAIKRAIGKSAYDGQAHAGSCTWANGIYWVEVLEKRPDGVVLVNNCGEVGKKKVDSVQVALEPDLLYPLLRGQDVERWKATPSLHIIMAQNPRTRKGWDEQEMMTKWPKTYEYLKSWEDELRKRSGFLKYFDTAADPFYSMYNIGPYTLAPFKVMWREVSIDIQAAVSELTKNGKKVHVPDHTLVAIACGDADEAHFICALLNSSPANFIVRGYIALHPSPHIMKYIGVPKFDRKDSTHLGLSKASRKAHSLAASESDHEDLAQVETEIDKLAAKLWGMSDAELHEVQASLKDLEE